MTAPSSQEPTPLTKHDRETEQLELLAMFATAAKNEIAQLRSSEVSLEINDDDLPPASEADGEALLDFWCKAIGIEHSTIDDAADENGNPVYVIRADPEDVEVAAAKMWDARRRVESPSPSPSADTPTDTKRLDWMQERVAGTGEPLTPMQPIHKAPDGVTRFRANPLVVHLLDHNGRINMNQLARVDATPDERAQFAELIGYSIEGYGELSYVSGARLAAAWQLEGRLSAKDAAASSSKESSREPTKEPRCPQCRGAVVRIRNNSPYLNDSQFDAVRAGDYYCAACPPNGRGKSQCCYWWTHEVLASLPRENQP